MRRKNPLGKPIIGAAKNDVIQKRDVFALRGQSDFPRTILVIAVRFRRQSRAIVNHSKFFNALQHFGSDHFISEQNWTAKYPGNDLVTAREMAIIVQGFTLSRQNRSASLPLQQMGAASSGVILEFIALMLNWERLSPLPATRQPGERTTSFRRTNEIPETKPFAKVVIRIEQHYRNGLKRN